MGNKCLNLNHPEIIKLAKQFNKMPFEIAPVISRFMEEYKTDLYPTYERLFYYIDSEQNKILEKDKIKKFSVNDNKNKIDALARKYSFNAMGYADKRNLSDHQAMKANQEFNPLGFKVLKNVNGNFRLINNATKKIHTPYYQITNEDLKISNVDSFKIQNKMRNLLIDLGIEYDPFTEIRDKDGKLLDVIAIANITEKIIKVVENKMDVTTLPEEAAHFFVKMLGKNNVLYKQMMNKITSYKLYDDVVKEYFKTYNGDLELLKEEAIGKLISRYIINNEVGEEVISVDKKEVEVVNKWWNNVWTKIKNIFNKLTQSQKDDIDPFFKIARDMATGNISVLENINLTDEEGEFYQLTNNQPNKIQQEILDSILNVQVDLVKVKKTDSTGVEKNSYTYKLNEIKESVTQKITRLGKKFDKVRTSEQEKEDSSKALFGNKIHDTIDNIAKRILMNDSAVQVENFTGNDNVYKVLEKYVKEIKTEYDQLYPGTIFLTEVMITDKKNLAGTFDFLAIRPDGTVDILDWKTRSYTERDKQNQGMPYFQREKYLKQIGEYKRLLVENYGVQKFGRMRLIPIDIELTGSKIDKLQNVQPGLRSIKIAGKEQIGKEGIEYLTPIPSVEETTGNEELDNIVKTLTKIQNDLDNIRESDLNKRDILEKRKQALVAAAREILIKGTFKAYVSSIKTEIANIEKLLKDDTEVDIAQLDEYYRLLEHISQINTGAALSSTSLDEKISQEDEKAVNEVSMKASKIKKGLEQKIKKELSKIAAERNVEDLYQPSKEIGAVARLFSAISTIDNPVFKTFWKLLQKQQSDMKRSLDEKLSKIYELTDKVREEQGSSNTFAKIINDKKDGLIRKRSKEFFDKLKEARANKDIKWLKENLEIKDPEALKKYLEEVRKSIKARVYNDDAQKNNIERERRLRAFNEKMDLFNHESAWTRADNYYLKFKDVETWNSSEWNLLNNGSNTALLDFYNYWTESMDEYKKFLPVDIYNNFLPNIEKNLIDQMMSSGGIKGMGYSVSDMFEYKSREGYGVIDPFTGDYEKRVPIYYHGELDPNLRSLDLGAVLGAYSKMALNYKYMSDIEGVSRSLRTQLAASKQYKTQPNGDVVMSNGNPLLVDINAETITAFDDLMNYYVYGIKLKGGEHTFKWGDKEYSMERLAKGGMSWLSAKSLGLNWISAISNMTGQMTNVYYQATRGKYFTRKQFGSAITDISTANGIAWSAIESFDLLGESDAYTRIKKLSVSKIVGKLDSNFLYAFLRAGDKAAQYTLLVSILKGNKIEDGKLVKSSTEDSIYSKLKITDDKLNLDEVLTQDQFDLIRAKVQRLSEATTGMSSRNNINTMNLTLMGSILMQFRRWIPFSASERFGGTYYDEDLEAYHKGKYMTFFQSIISKQFLPLAKELFTGFGTDTRAKAKEMWLSELKRNPNLKITEEEYYQLHVENLKAMMAELQIIVGFAIALFSISRAFDDDKDKPTVMLKIFNRTYDELGFFLIPSNMTSILKSPIPIVSFVNDIFKLFENMMGEAFYTAIQDEKGMRRMRPTKYFMKLFPITNEIDKTFDLLNVLKDK